MKRLLLLPGLALLAGPLLAQNAPNPPVVTEPFSDGQQVNLADVHMETGPFSDPDAGDTHFCTDWELWLDAERVWVTSCIQGVERVHTHLGDGTFEGSHAGRRELLPEQTYRLRVRHQDQAGRWSAYSERTFVTGSLSTVFPMSLEDVADTPTPQYADETGVPIALSGSASLRLEHASGTLLLELSGSGVQNPPGTGLHEPVRVRLTGSLVAPAGVLTFTGGDGVDQALYLPSFNLAAGQQATFWVSTNGSTFAAQPGQTAPDFTTLVQGAAVPWQVVVPGYRIERVATGFQLPVNIAFVPNPGPNPDDPFYYVTELYGTIKVVLRNGVVRDFATGLLNFNPTGLFPGSGEQGLTGIAVDPATGDVYAALLYDAGGPHFPKVVRFTSTDGGRTAATETTVLDMPGETQGQSHQISTVTIGPDARLYVHMGDGFDASKALDLSSFRGKVLRLNLDGTAPSDNPFYNAADGITARDYVFAYGLRNPFGGGWRLRDGNLYCVENGNEANDRLARITRGTSYGWNNTAASMTTNALYNWVQTHAPVNITFVEPERFGGSGFPESVYGNALVTESGGTWATGPQGNGKRIVQFRFDAPGTLLSGPQLLAAYNGTGKASASALAAGPDGVYFADLYKDQGYASPIDRGANIFRIRFVGTADFTAAVTSGEAPFAVSFTDLSSVPGATTWAWDFGDGQTSTERNPVHTYTQDGFYNVRLTVTGTAGAAIIQKNGYIFVGAATTGIVGRYFDNRTLDGTHRFTRVDPAIDFTWGSGAPDPRLPADDFSVQWSGYLVPPQTGFYTFHATADDGVRLWVNDTLRVDQWIDQSPTTYSATAGLRRNQPVPLRMEFYERGGGAVARLEWTDPDFNRQVLGSPYLFTAPPKDLGGEEQEPPGPTLTLTHYPNPVRDETTVVLNVPESGPVRLVLVNLLGQRLATLLDDPDFEASQRTLSLPVAPFAAGLYFLRLEADGKVVTSKMVVVK